MQTAGQISEETLQILALALNEEDMAHQPVRDMSTQTYAEHTVQPYSLRSLLDATIRLHNQRLSHEQQWLRNPEYFKLDEWIIIEEVGKANNYLDPGDRQDVRISARNLHEPSDDNDMLSLQTLIARWPLILVGEDGHEPTKDSGAEDLAYYVIEEQHQCYHGTDKTVVNSGIT